MSGRFTIIAAQRDKRAMERELSGISPKLARNQPSDARLTSSAQRQSPALSDPSESDRAPVDVRSSKKQFGHSHSRQGRLEGAVSRGCLKGWGAASP